MTMSDEAYGTVRTMSDYDTEGLVESLRGKTDTWTVRSLGPLVIAEGNPRNDGFVFCGHAQDYGYRVGMTIDAQGTALYVPEEWREGDE